MTTLSSAERLPSNEGIPVRPSVAKENPPDASWQPIERVRRFSYENEQLFRDSDGRIVDLRFQRVRGAPITLPEQTFSARSHHYDHHRSG